MTEPYRALVGLCGVCGTYVEPYREGERCWFADCYTVTGLDPIHRRRRLWIDPLSEAGYATLTALHEAREREGW